eukprot:CAMPEP_0204618982 /NCGR_PEP_ID=MMETSP0717-20131115/5472_1 /ASSEMBLY_ACC=CAM_ASM_000666 /TAXON_ID=230516 /ORGANISM="Chaetoceros curvisetus" /LENGTH=352 /DNA_ID=CAMNT_0051632853 /DNA_START=473 /DNA_END=1531 /DNA_ORIENTATION=+
MEHEFIRHADIVNVDGYEYNGTRVGAKGASVTSSISPPSAVEIAELTLEIGSIQKPIVNINATNITVNVVFSADKLMIGSNLEVSIPSIKLGDWTVDELISMIPDPPETVGLYPRLGIVNLTDVTVIINDERDDGRKQDATVKIFDLPNELFLPLMLLTQKASGGTDGGGIDRTDIQDVIRESAMVAFRKYILGEDTILKTMRKPAEFVETLRIMMESLHHEKDQVIEHHWSKVRQFLSDIEQSWNDAIHDQNGQFFKITNELLGGWHSFKDFVTDSMVDTEANLGLFLEHVEEEAEQVRRDVEHLVESGLHVAKQMELGLEQLIENGLNDAKGKMHQFFAEKIEQIYDEEF